jgi:Ca-activated chloride channel family protein
MHRTTVRSVLSTLLALTAAAGAQGLHVHVEPLPPDQRTRPPVRVPVRLTQLHVQAQITDGVATTELRQTFRNDGDAIAEGTWILPLPANAVADRFTMTVGGKELPAEVLDAQRARGIYEEIVRRQRDPGLLEYFGTGCLRARVFPIPARGEVAVLVRWRQVLPETAGMHQWTFPLRAAGVGSQPAEHVAVDVRIQSTKPLKNVWSPVAGAEAVRTGEHQARVTMELKTAQRPEQDLAVFYGLSEKDFGLHVLTHRRPGEPGWFLMLVAPRHDAAQTARTPRAIRFVLDTSGSMQGAKIQQARDALRFFLRSLQPTDHFDVIPFSTEARPFFDKLVPAAKENVDRAVALCDGLEARGGTNIDEALGAALKPLPPDLTGTLPITVFVTDGQPTVGITDAEQLLAEVGKRNAAQQRIFVFGVGSDVNTRLLDSLAERSRGERDYVREGENLEVKTSALFEKLSHPVLTNLELACEGLDAHDLQPKALPDLFKGSRLLVFGRYRGSGHQAVRLKGLVEGKPVEFVFEHSFPAATAEHGFVATLWAQRKVAVLLDAIRLHGQNPELVDEVRRLGKEFGIVTPFTSHLVLEEGQRVAQAAGRAPGGFFGREREERDRAFDDLERSGAVPAAPAARGRMQDELTARADELAKSEAKDAGERLKKLGEQTAGEQAVADSVLLLRLANDPAATRRGDGAGLASLTSRRIGDKTFHLAGGVWIDSAFRPELRDRTKVVEAFGEEYFALLAERPELARYLAFSTRIVIVLGDRAIEVR